MCWSHGHVKKLNEDKELVEKDNFLVGDVLVAKWEVDNIWYNVKVED
jgi:hypothetical protein